MKSRKGIHRRTDHTAPAARDVLQILADSRLLETGEVP